MKILFTQAKDFDYNKFLEYFKTTLSDNFPFYSADSVGYIVEVEYSTKWLKEKLFKKAKKVFLAKDNKEIAGYLLVTKQIAGVSYADWLAVDKNYRKMGIASSLIDLWEKEAIKEGAHVLFLWTTIANIQFYKNRGFVLGGQFPKAWHGVNSYLLYKPLREPKEENYLKEYLKSKKNNE